MYNQLIKNYPDFKNTCPIDNLDDYCFTFIRNKKYLKILEESDFQNVIILVPNSFKDIKLPDYWKFEYVYDVDFIFTMIHNTLWRFKRTQPPKNIIGDNCFIHETAVIDVEGIHVAKAPNGSRAQMKHIGNVIIEDNVMILALSTIQKGIFGSTIISQGVKIDSRVNIGHNSYIGENTAIALGSIVGGSCMIGRNCMLGLGCIIRNGIRICDNVIVGQGSNVISDIEKPGIYMGNPAKLYKDYDVNWNY
jgi:acetyltransferase-like isoleucine patch superfamily enzyme